MGFVEFGVRGLRFGGQGIDGKGVRGKTTNDAMCRCGMSFLFLFCLSLTYFCSWSGGRSIK